MEDKTLLFMGDNFSDAIQEQLQAGWKIRYYSTQWNKRLKLVCTEVIFERNTTSAGDSDGLGVSA